MTGYKCPNKCRGGQYTELRVTLDGPRIICTLCGYRWFINQVKVSA